MVQVCSLEGRVEETLERGGVPGKGGDGDPVEHIIALRDRAINFIVANNSLLYLDASNN